MDFNTEVLVCFLHPYAVKLICWFVRFWGQFLNLGTNKFPDYVLSRPPLAVSLYIRDCLYQQLLGFSSYLKDKIVVVLQETKTSYCLENETSRSLDWIYDKAVSWLKFKKELLSSKITTKSYCFDINKVQSLRKNRFPKEIKNNICCLDRNEKNRLVIYKISRCLGRNIKQLSEEKWS